MKTASRITLIVTALTFLPGAIPALIAVGVARVTLWLLRD